MSDNKKTKKKITFKSFGLLALCFVFVVFLVVFAFTKVIFKNDYYKVVSRTDKVKTTKVDYPDDPLETVGWIQVQGTNIDYPVVFKDTLEAFPGEISKYGWLTNYDNKFTNHMRISGHNLFNLSSTPKMESKLFERFESLMSFVYYDFAKDNKYIQFTYDGKEYVYKIFSTAFISNSTKYDFPVSNEYSSKEMDEYIKVLKKNSIYDYDVDVNKNDKIISVITCTRFFGLDDNLDFRIVGRLVRENEKLNNYSVKKNKNYEKVEKKLKGDEENVEA